MSFPLPEITNLHQGPANASVVHVPPGGTAILGHGNQVDLELGFTLASGGLNENVSMSVRAFGNSTGGGGKELTIGSERTAAGGVIGRLDSNAFAITREAKSIELRLLIDHSVVEAYAQGGRAVATRPFCPPSADDQTISVVNHGSTGVLVKVNLAKMATANVLPPSAQLPEDMAF